MIIKSLVTLSLLMPAIAIPHEGPLRFGPWKGFSTPEILGSGFTHKLNDLPLEGSILGGTNLWSGPYWPSRHGGINIRWNSPTLEKFDYKSPPQSVVMKMSEDQLSQLSATEKYDLFLGRYDYPLKKEAEGTASKRAKEWAGICHGWAPASLHHNEPTPKIMINPDGLKIPFGSADVKALVSYYYAFNHEPNGQAGLRCFFGSWMGGARACSNDLNAGAFHIVITNKIGLQKEGLMMDADRFREVWNQPIAAYKSTIINGNLPVSSDAAKLTVREMRVKTELFYIDESDANWNVVHGTEMQLLAKKDLVYRLELNAQGQIIGGDWESEERPDFLWNMERVEEFKGQFSKLPELLND